MPLIRKFAVQGHAIPRTAHAPRGPFPPEVLAQAGVSYDNTHGESLHPALDDVRLFRCRACGTLVGEDELSEHDCDD
jgi:hypothetical protein